MNNKKYSIDIHNDLEAVKSNWIKFQKEAQCYPFQFFEWAENWVHTVGTIENYIIKIVEIKYNDDIIMILPFIIKNKYGIKILTWLGGDYCCGLFKLNFDKIISKNSFIQIWYEIISKIGSFDLIYFSMQPSLVGNLPNPFVKFFNSYGYHAKSYQIDISNGLDLYKKNQKKKLMKDTERQINRLNKIGKLSFKIANDINDYSKLTNHMVDLKSEQYIRTKVKNIFENESYKNFYHSFYEQESQQQFLHLSCLNLDSESIAVHWGLLDKKNNTLFYLMPSHDNNKWSKYSPGRILMIKLLEWCENNNIKIFDMTSGNERYKQTWSNKNITIYNFLESKTLKGFIVKVILSIRHYMRRKKLNGRP